MPFVTEEIWEKLTGHGGTLVVTAFPRERPEWADRARGGVGRGSAGSRHARAQLPLGARSLAHRARGARGRPGGLRRWPAGRSARARAPAVAPGASVRSSLRAAFRRRVTRRRRGDLRRPLDVAARRRCRPFARREDPGGDRRGDRRRWPPSCATPPSWTARRLRSSKRCGSGWSSSSSGAPPSPAHDSFRRRGDRGAALADFREPRLPGADPLLERPRPGAHRAVLQRGPGPASGPFSSPRARRRRADATAPGMPRQGAGSTSRSSSRPGDPALRRSDRRGALGPGGGAGELRRQSRSEVAQRPLRRKAQARRDPARSAHAGRNDLPGGRDRPERHGPRRDARGVRRPRPSRRRPGARFRARQSFRRCSTGSIGSSSSPIGTERSPRGSRPRSTGRAIA